MKNLKDIKPGTLIRLNSKADLKGGPIPRFCPVGSDGIIRNDIHWKDRTTTSLGTLLLFVKPLDYSKETASAAAATVAWAVAAWEKAREEFGAIKKISGGVFLTPDGKLVWISHYDLEYFEGVMTSK